MEKMIEISDAAPVTIENAIVVERLPVIREQLLLIREQVEERVTNAQKLECNAETVKFVKNERAELNKMHKVLEDKRKEVKRAVLEPYEVFQKVYDELIGGLFEETDRVLKGKITEYENNQKEELAKKVRAFFDEYASSLGIDFVGFERAGIRVTLSASQKKLFEQVREFLDKVADGLSLIETMEHKDEILVEFYKTLNASNAIQVVHERHKAIEEMNRRAEETSEMEKVKQEAVKKVDAVIEKEENELKPPVVKEAEKEFQVKFTVFGTLEQLKKLKEFLVDGGYRYE